MKMFLNYSKISKHDSPVLYNLTNNTDRLYYNGWNKFRRKYVDIFLAYYFKYDPEIHKKIQKYVGPCKNIEVDNHTYHTGAHFESFDQLYVRLSAILDNEINYLLGCDRGLYPVVTYYLPPVHMMRAEDMTTHQKYIYTDLEIVTTNADLYKLFTDNSRLKEIDSENLVKELTLVTRENR